MTIPEGGSAIAAGGHIPGVLITALAVEAGASVTYLGTATDGRPVRVKTVRAQYPPARELAALRREYAMLSSLNVPGVDVARALLPYGTGNLALVTEDFGRPLASVLAARAGEPLPVTTVLLFALRVAKLLGALHEQDVVHNDVMPINLLVDESTWDVRLVGFGLASELASTRASSALSGRVDASLPYLSPEGSGRTSRDVDWRSDYYAFGVTLFELLTGTLPFEANDALEWAHRHLSQPPPLAHERRREVPEMLSRLVAKLMAKNAEDRYQGTFSLIADLERIRGEFRNSGRVTPFELGSGDLSSRFHLPQHLYGREDELAQLQAVFEDVSHGLSAFVLVSGYSGVGKSALVSELGRDIAKRRGYLVEGKFDQYQQASAYAAVATALQGLVQRLLGEPPHRLAAWKTAILDRVGANAALMTALVPDLALILGEVPPVAPLPSTEAQTRFQLAMIELIRVLATADHPLVLFLDDLQWSDIPTLHLLTRLASARDVGHLLVIGAYRNNAVDAAHPLTITLDQIRRVRELTEIALAPLAASAVDRLVEETLHTGRGEALELSRTIFDKAQGNPLFVRELLRVLHENDSITFDRRTGRWRWDDAAVAFARVGDNVVDFLVATLRALPEETQEVLRLAACIGSSFDLRTLAVIARRQPIDIAFALQPALQRLAVVPVTDQYALALHGAADDETVNSTYRFQHDRVQQAAYELVDEERRQQVHHSIGQLLLAATPEHEREGRLIDIVTHLNHGRRLTTTIDERRTLATLNFDAGRLAARSAAYESARGFLGVALQLTDDSWWSAQHPFMMTLGTELQRAAYQVADYDEADRWTERLLAEARTPLAMAEVLSDRVRQYATMGRMRESIDAALAGLAVLGLQVPALPTRADVQKEMAAVSAALDGRDIESLLYSPEISDPEARIAVCLIMEVFAASFLSGAGEIFPFLILRNVRLALTHGASAEAAFAYVAYGMLLCGSLGDPATGARYGRLGVDMNTRFDDLTLRARIIYVYAMFIHHWSHHWQSMTPWFQRGIEAGYQSGDMLYLAFSAQDCILWDPTLDLATSSRETRKYLTIVKDCDYQDSYDSGSLHLQMQLNFLGRTDGTFSMNDAEFDEERVVSGMQARSFMTGVANYHIYKAEIHALYGDWTGALPHVEAQDRLVASAMSLPQLVRYRIVAFLVRSSLFDSLPADARAEERERLEAHRAQMAVWAANCRENFEHLRLTMDAELARLDGRVADAMLLFEQAIAAAHGSGFLRDEAVANELAARMLINAGTPRAAEGYLHAARHAYELWGAERRIAQLDRMHPLLDKGMVATNVATYSGMATADSSAMDMVSVIKASQTISGEIVVEQLLRTTLQLLLENAGGNLGYFVVLEDDQLVLRALAGEAVPDPERRLPVLLDAEAEPLLPLTIVRQVLRTGAPLVLANGAEAERYMSDPYIRSHRPRSVICVPMSRGERFSGAVYLENTLVTGAFTADRVEVIKLLAAQAAISMENAALYEEQLALTAAQERFVPAQFLQNLGHRDIAGVGLGEFVAREMSVLFADLRGFTPLAEQMPPRDVIDLLNRYFSTIGVPIVDAGGFVDSYNGDEIMALFPLPADLAVKAGIRMATMLRDFNEESRRRGAPSLNMGIGVNSGPLVLGTVGSADRLKCGVVGDTVNTASRIEQLTKRYGAQLLIGESTQQRLRDASVFSLRAVDRVAAKGKANAMTLFEVLDAEEAGTREARERTRPLLNEGRAHLARREFEQARRVFDSATGEDPYDPLFPLLAARARRYENAPPPDDWQGVETLDSK